MSRSEGTDGTALPLHVEISGRGPPLVLLHGFGATSYTWRHWAPELTGRHTVALVDLKGFGRAPAPDDGRYGPRDQAELVARLILERDLADATVVGHSLGGGIALLVALLLRDRGEGRRVARLVSVAGAAYHQPLPFYVRMARRRLVARALLRGLPTGWLIRTVLESIVHDPGSVTDDQVRAYAEPLETRAGRHALVESALQILPEDLERWTRRFPELDVPTLLLWGRGDTVVPPWVGQRLEADLPRSALVVLPDCGHIPQEERPAESLEALTAFLGRTRDVADAG